MQTTLNPTRETMNTRLDNAPPGRPAGHRVLIQPDEMPETSGRIIIPPTVRENYAMATESGTVICVGETAFMGYGDSRPWCEAGDHVRYTRYAGKYVEIPLTPFPKPRNPGNIFTVINDEDIFFVDGKANVAEVDNAGN